MAPTSHRRNPRALGDAKGTLARSYQSKKNTMEHEWIKVVYRDENGKKIDSKWVKVMAQGNCGIDRAMKEGLAEAMKPRITWEIVETCMTKPCQ